MKSARYITLLIIIVMLIAITIRLVAVLLDGSATDEYMKSTMLTGMAGEIFYWALLIFWNKYAHQKTVNYILLVLSLLPLLLLLWILATLNLT